MADNVLYTMGSGTSIATDDVGSVHFQKVKLDVGGDGSSLQPMGSIPVYVVSGTGAYAMNDPFVDAIAIAGMFDDIAIVSGTENNIAPIRITAARAQHVNLRDALGFEMTPLDLPIIMSGEAQIWSYHENSSSALTDTIVKTAPGVGLSLYITDVMASIGGATAFSLLIEEDTTTTILGPYYLEAVNGRGFALQYRTPKQVTTNTSLTVTTTGAVAHSIDILGYVGRT